MEGAIVSYVLAQDEVDERLDQLKAFLELKQIQVDMESLRHQVHKVKDSLGRPKKMDALMAKLFNKDGTPRKYRHGNAFCPKCKIFKNYEKECPYCRHLELSI